ncbi:MAG: DNA polymerase [Candidatus Acidiferrales bacterium]
MNAGRSKQDIADTEKQEGVLFLGIKDGKEHYLHPSDKEHPKPYIVRRVPNVREALVAGPGWRILVTDYSQVEMRIMAAESNDLWMLEVLNSGSDIYCLIAADLYGASYEEVCEGYKNRDSKYEGWRSDAKGVALGVPYGLTAKGMAEKRGISEEKAQDIIDRYKGKAHVLSAWLENNAANAVNLGISTGNTGHYRFYQLPHPDDEDFEERISQIKRWAKNHPIQSGCASLLKMAVGKMYLDFRNGVSSGPNMYDAHFLLFVHDELVITAPVEHVENVKQIMIDDSKWAFKKFWKDAVDFPVKVTVADYYKKD